MRLQITLEQLNNEEFISDGKTKESFCMNCISNIITENDLYLDMTSQDNETIIFQIIDENSKINEVPYEFYFANKYMIN
jgi:hypothetical protein